MQKPHPPIYASGVITPESCIWAGSQGFHLATAFFVPLRERVQENIRLYRQALQEHGHNPNERDIAGVFQMYRGESNEEAQRNGGEYVLNYYRFFGGLDQRSPHRSQAFAAHGGGISKVFAGITYDAIDKKNLILIGDAENLVARIKWAREFYGTNYLILEVAQGGMPHKHVMPSLERFAKYVMPHFR